MPSHDILLVDDDPGAIQVMSQLLNGMGRTRFATSGQAALRLAREFEPSLVLLDAEMPGMNGFKVCEALKGDRALRDVPVVFVTSHDDPDFELASFRIGAADFITKPVNPELALARIGLHLNVNQQTQDLRRLLTVDPQTGAMNHHGFREAIKREWRRALRYGQALALMMVDVDQFEPLRLARGERIAELTLNLVSRALRSTCLRPGDTVARVDDHRFAVILPHTPREGAEHVAHRVLDEIEALKLPHPESMVATHVTASVGIGCFDQASPHWVWPEPTAAFARSLEDMGTSEELVHATMLALRAAKFAGGAQGWIMDVADAHAPQHAREIHAATRESQRRRPNLRVVPPEASH